MTTLLTILHVLVCLFLMLTVLLQEGKGGGMGGAFGGGGNAATVFGGSGASTFLRKLTAVAGTVFMATSMILAYLASHRGADSLERYSEQQAGIVKQRQDAKAKALLAGSGSALAPSPDDSEITPLTPMPGSAGSAGSATTTTAPTPTTDSGKGNGSAGLALPTAPTPGSPAGAWTTGSPPVKAGAPSTAPAGTAEGSGDPGTATTPSLSAAPPADKVDQHGSHDKAAPVDDGKTPDQRLRDSVK